MDGVAGQMELAALPSGTAEDGAPGGAQPAVVVRDDEYQVSLCSTHRSPPRTPAWTPFVFPILGGPMRG